MTKPFSEEVKVKLQDAYQDVRKDGSETRWCVATYIDNGKTIDLEASGVDYSEFLEYAKDDQRFYGYVRFETGDEMSKRAKFAFITWIGPSVSPLKKAKVSTDKAFIKDIFNSFGKEVLADDRSELNEDKVKILLAKASGANYGTGK